jgi:hypothetical protein
MAVGVKAGKDVISFREGREVVLILQEALRQFSIAGIAAAQVGDVKVFWKGVSFVPTVGDILVRQGASLDARLRAGRQVRQHRIGCVAEHRQSHRVAGKRVGIQQAHVGLVERVRRQRIVDIELLRYGRPKPLTSLCTFSWVGLSPVIA